MGPTSKEKREELKRHNAKIAGYQQLVSKANHQVDPLVDFPVFKSYNKNDLQATIYCSRVTQLDANVVNWTVDLLQRNMRTMYEQSQWGWDLRKKRKEMTEEEAWFDMDYDRPVLYCYEVQVEPTYLRKGLGKFLMQLLALMAFKSQLHKVVLTVFRHNSDARAFFQSLGYSTDETSPDEDEADYIILSRINPQLATKYEA